MLQELGRTSLPLRSGSHWIWIHTYLIIRGFRCTGLRLRYVSLFRNEGMYANSLIARRPTRHDARPKHRRISCLHRVLLREHHLRHPRPPQLKPGIVFDGITVDETQASLKSTKTPTQHQLGSPSSSHHSYSPQGARQSSSQPSQGQTGR